MNLLSPMEWQLQLHQQMLYRQHQITTLHQNRPEEGSNSLLVPPNPDQSPRLPSQVKIELQNDNLWRQFHSETTEMIITKLGRRMFPSVQVNVSGLDKRERYCLLLEVMPSSTRRHKYVIGNEANGPKGWLSAGPAERQPGVNRRVYLHPDSPATGAHWMQHSVSFSKLKLTNSTADHHNNVVLTSMHKYKPRIWIIKCDDVNRIGNLCTQPASSFVFNETEFIAVTAYQNENITKLKIDNNPFAKGFRESGQSRCKRKLFNPDNSYEEEEAMINVTDEEGNGSSSESDSGGRKNGNYPDENPAHHQRPKRTRSSESGSDDSGVSSSGGVTPPLMTMAPSSPADNHQRRRLHRPWTTDSPAPAKQPRIEEQNRVTAAPSSLAMPFHQHQMYNPLFAYQTTQYPTMELHQRLQQLEHYHHQNSLIPKYYF